MTTYYVAPDPAASGGENYWVEGYAVNDPKFSGMLATATATTLAGSTRVRFSGIQ